MKIPAALAGIIISFSLSLLAASCGWHIFPYEDRDEDYVSDDRVIGSLDEIAGDWRSGEDLALRYALGDDLAYLSVDGVEDIEANLNDLTGKTPFVEGEFRIYWPSNEGETVRVCQRGDYFIAQFTHIPTNSKRTYELTKQ